MSDITPITREERLLNSISDGVDSGLEPPTREEHYLSAIAGETDLQNHGCSVDDRYCCQLVCVVY